MEIRKSGINILKTTMLPPRLLGRAAVSSAKLLVEAVNRPGIVDRLKDEGQAYEMVLAEKGLAYAKEQKDDNKFETTQLCHVVKILGRSLLRKIDAGEEISQVQLFRLQCGKDDLPSENTFESLGFNPDEVEKLEKALTDLSITSTD